MGATMLDLYRAQQSAGDRGGRIEGGTLSPDTRMPPPATPHKAAVRLAQECGKAVAHCCLALLELQAYGWHDTGPTTDGPSQKGEPSMSNAALAADCVQTGVRLEKLVGEAQGRAADA
jgi:hypothetical protein